MGKVSVSLLSSDLAHLADACNMINASDAWSIHMDIMDGVFVPNISYGFPVIEAISRFSKKTLDAHLMTVDPSRYYQRYRDSGISWLTVHWETCPHLNRDLQEQAVHYADLVLIMSVNPGFGGQVFIPESLEKIRELKEMRTRKNLDFLIQVDGGINDKNASELYEAGADILVAGNYIFKAEDPLAAIRAII